MAENKLNNPVLGQMKADPFEFAARLRIVLENREEILKLDVSDIEKLSEITRAASGACGVACGGC